MTKKGSPKKRSIFVSKSNLKVFFTKHVQPKEFQTNGEDKINQKPTSSNQGLGKKKQDSDKNKNKNKINSTS